MQTTTTTTMIIQTMASDSCLKSCLVYVAKNEFIFFPKLFHKNLDDCNNDD